MAEHKKIRSLDDFFTDAKKRRSSEVYFYRINGYTAETDKFIRRYYEEAKRSGAVIEGKIQNPDEKNLSYYNEIMGMDFRCEAAFIENGLRKWLPRMKAFQRELVSQSIYDVLIEMKKNGKNDNILKNAYIKFMCWLYYRFEHVVNRLGEDKVPKILYEGNISKYELMLMCILSGSGCDVVLLQYSGDGDYLKLDPNSRLSDELHLANMVDFPSDYCIKKVRADIQKAFDNERLYGVKPDIVNCTNAWISGKGLEDIKTAAATRGADERFFYNCFCRICGVEDKVTYADELYRLLLEMKNSGRKVVIVNGPIPKPTNDEISKIKRANYSNSDQLIMGLAENIKCVDDTQLQKIMRRSFVDIMISAREQIGENINRLTNKAVYLLCWLKRYENGLFANRKQSQISCYISMGGCRDDNEAMFLRFLARTPTDVLILCPNLDSECCLADSLLYEINYSQSLVLDTFPEDNSQTHIATAAYHAERELDTLMYRDSGLYRDRQYDKINVINLQTIYEEISILWNEELKYRPSFSAVDGVVNVPVIFAKISGVKSGMTAPYWESIKQLLTSETLFVKDVPFIGSTEPNPMKAYAVEFYKNGKLQKSKIKNHQKYPYAILKDETQDLLLDKLALLLEQKLIKGIGENGTEYTVIAQILNLPKEIVRMIQNFDFTKKNPKLVYVNTTDKMISLEDSIVTVFLNLVGFDVVFFVPTGYRSIEKYLGGKMPEEHQIGEYKYDLQVPDMKNITSENVRRRWRDKIFKRGN